MVAAIRSWLRKQAIIVASDSGDFRRCIRRICAHNGWTVLCHLGASVYRKHWSPLIHVKHDHELMQTGPYRVVRHPIYAGLMLATLGTAIAYGLLSALIGFFLVVVAWGYKARLEESVMLEQFGRHYEQYRQNVKKLIPWIW
jgi:protein-S-isoprenylcysteine O-methyltransferase Ste14